MLVARTIKSGLIETSMSSFALFLYWFYYPTINNFTQNGERSPLRRFVSLSIALVELEDFLY